MRADIEAFYDEATHTITYLVCDPATGQAAVIDPVMDYEPKAARLTTASADRLLARISDKGLTLAWILETHAHADHLTAADYLRRQTGAPVAVGDRIVEVQQRFGPLFDPEGGAPGPGVFDRLLDDGAMLPLGDLVISALHTPGHTPACVTYLIDGAAFVGDTLFMPDYGTARADFPGGSAVTLYRSIRRILDLPPETRLFTGHDYRPPGRDEPAWESSVSEQWSHNVQVHAGVSEAEFVIAREARDRTLEPPVLILPSLQVNIRAGKLPDPAANGRTYLTLPVNTLG